MERFAPALGYIRHMRLGFQLLLAPLFLWGLLLSGGRIGGGAAFAFLSLHLFLYPGATAFNSAFDRDTGPVSGLAEPVGVPPRLLGFSILLQALGALFAVAVGAAFTFLYLALSAVFFGYSHPGLRWKAHPVASAIAVFAGQGMLGFAAGWTVSGTGLEPGARFLAGAVAAGFTALGLYPSTQIFQVEEDRRRGDRTLAVALGPARALRLGALCLLVAAASACWAALPGFGAAAAALIGSGYILLAAQHLWFAGHPRSEAESFRWATRLRLQATAFFLLLLAWLLFQ